MTDETEGDVFEPCPRPGCEEVVTSISVSKDYRWVSKSPADDGVCVTNEGGVGLVMYGHDREAVEHLPI